MFNDDKDILLRKINSMKTFLQILTEKLEQDLIATFVEDNEEISTLDYQNLFVCIDEYLFELKDAAQDFNDNEIFQQLDSLRELVKKPDSICMSLAAARKVRDGLAKELEIDSKTSDEDSEDE